MSNAQFISNPAVSASGTFDSLLIEKFTGLVHQAYTKGENLLSFFDVQDCVGTDTATNKYMGETTLQVLLPGEDPTAMTTDFEKNSVRVDTTVIARNTVAMINDIQNDFKVQSKLAETQMGQLKSLEDQAVLSQLMVGGLTGGKYDPYTPATAITGGKRRVAGQGVAIKQAISPAQAKDAIQLYSAIELAVHGLVVQRTPVAKLKVIVPIAAFGTLQNYGLLASTFSGSNGFENSTIGNMRGYMKTLGIEVIGSAEFSQLQINPANTSRNHHLLSNANNKYRYDVTDDMKKCQAIVFGADGLLCGRSISPQGDIFFDKRSKSYFIDTWFAEGMIADRYDNLAVVIADGVDDETVKTWANGKRLPVNSMTAA